MEKYNHSVILDESLCKGCTNCIKKCPTEAIRVRDGKARIESDRCIDCAECIRTCPYKAKVASVDSWDKMADYKYSIALPAPTLYSQFDSKYSRADMLVGLKQLGFDYVYEVARGAEIITELTNRYLQKSNKPVISSACPAIVRLIQIRFPNLIKNILPFISPMEVAARNARRIFCQTNNVFPDDVGVFFLSPCAAKMTAVRSPLDLVKSNCDAVIPIKTVYFKLLKQMSKNDRVGTEGNENFVIAGSQGIRWASIGGESAGLKTNNVLFVDGVSNVLRIFEELENDKLKDVDFIEASACTGGCLGGPLTAENLYVAKSRSNRAASNIPALYSEITPDEMDDCIAKREIVHRDVSRLDDDITEAMKKLTKMNSICRMLPALDCGACGAPNCKALAEDIVRGCANITDCIFILRNKVRSLAEEMISLEGMMPPVMRKSKNKDDKYEG